MISTNKTLKDVKPAKAAGDMRQSAKLPGRAWKVKRAVAGLKRAYRTGTVHPYHPVRRRAVVLAVVLALFGILAIVSSLATSNSSPDIDGDGKVTLHDLSVFLSLYGTTDGRADFDGDGKVALHDLSILLANYGKTYTPNPTPTPTPTPQPSAPAAPTGLLAFTGGTSIAVRWSEATPIASIRQYNIFRDGRQVATVTPGFHADFPEKDGNGYIDYNVTRGTTYSYQVQAVGTNGAASTLSAAKAATHPINTTPVPTITYDVSAAPDLEDYTKNMVIPFLKVWYPKVSDYEAYPNYVPFNTFKLTYDPNLTAGLLVTPLADGTITANSNFVRDNYQTAPDRVLGAWLHESTHTIQGQASAAGNNGPTLAIEGGADYSREYILHDRDPVVPTGNLYYNSGYSPSSYFLNYIQQHYDANYVRRVTVDSHNNAFSAADAVINGKNLDELWAEMMGLPSTTGHFQNQANTGYCVDDVNGSVVLGNKIQIYACQDNNNNQKLTAHRNNDGSSSIYVLAGCLDVQNAGTANGTPVWYYRCSGSVAQKWVLHSDGTITNPNSGKCLEVAGGNNGITQGSQIEIWDCNGGAWQKWNVPPGSPTQP